MELSRPFVRLPFAFDVDRLIHEVEQFNAECWMSHPNRLHGNTALPLIALNGDNNDDFSGHMRPTEHLHRCDYIQQIMASFDEVLARSRLMKLAAGAQVAEHVDFNYHWYSRVRIHIPIITHPDVIFYCGDEHINMQAGECWIFDSWRRHKVINASGEDRTHLVIDLAGSSRFWAMVRRMETFGHHYHHPDLEKQCTLLHHQASTPMMIKTERYNVAPVMSPGELEAIAKELITDVKANPDNNPLLLQEYATLLDELAKDWRETWLVYGYDADGIDQYRALLNRTVKRLRPNPRVLVTASNDVGINPIIMQRILRAALNAEQLSRFSQPNT